MRLIGRLTSGLVGILLILNTTVLWASEPDTPVTPLLMRWREYDSYKSGLEATLPGLHDSYTVIPAIPNYHFVYTDISNDGWMYMTVGEEFALIGETSPPIGSVYRMRGDGSQRERIAEGVCILNVTFSLDGQWLVFQRTDGDFYRVRVDGTSLENLTQEYTSKSPFLRIYGCSSKAVVSPDNQWLWFNAAPDPRSPYSLYRVPFDPSHSQPAEAILGEKGLYMGIHDWPFDSEWMILSVNEMYYRFNAATHELLPLFNVPAGYQLEYFTVLLPKHDLLLVRGVKRDGDTIIEYGAWGLRLGDSEPLWVIQNRYGRPRIERYSDDGVYWFSGNTFNRMRWDGKQGDTTNLGSPSFYRDGNLSSDKQWIYFSAGDYTSYLFRGWLSANRVEELAEFNNADALDIAPSPDGKWVAVSAVDHSPQPPQSDVYLMRPDGSDLHQVAQIEGDASVIWSIPVVRTWQPIPLMLIAIALLVIGLIPRRWFRFLHRQPVLMSRTLIL